jgi:hypothetical protein
MYIFYSKDAFYVTRFKLWCGLIVAQKDSMVSMGDCALIICKCVLRESINPFLKKDIYISFIYLPVNTISHVFDAHVYEFFHANSPKSGSIHYSCYSFCNYCQFGTFIDWVKTSENPWDEIGRNWQKLHRACGFI